MFKKIKKINDYTETNLYSFKYYFVSIIAFIISYLSQYLSETPCHDFSAIVIRTFHHFIVFFIYFGFLAPTNNLEIISFLVGSVILSWLLFNRCIITLLENKICGKDLSMVFRDITFYISEDFDKYLSGIRIYIVAFVFIIILIRLYVYNYYDDTYKNKIEIHAHRGARGKFYGNTMSSFKYALDNNIDILELDLQLTKDNQIIIYHDKNIDDNICTGKNVPIKNLLLSQIKSYNCNTYVNEQITKKNIKEKILTFQELIDEINKNYKSRKIIFNIEIKTKKDLDITKDVKKFVILLLDKLYYNNLEEKVIIQSFDFRALKFVKEINYNIKTSYLVRDKLDDQIIYQARFLGVEYISPEFSLITKENVELIHKNKIKVLPWTVNNINIFKKLIKYNVDGIITDYPVEMKEYLYS